MIRGYHVYQDIWSSHINESLPCKRERHNLHDPFAVSVLKDADVVGHIPRKISTICYVFLGRPGSTITCKVTGTRRYSSDLPQGGMEIPCLLEFKGEQSVVEKARKLLNEKLNTCVPTTPTVAPAVSEPVKRASVNTTSIPVEKSTPDHPNSHFKCPRRTWYNTYSSMIPVQYHFLRNIFHFNNHTYIL